MKRVFLKIMGATMVAILIISICAEYFKGMPIWLKYLTIPFSSILTICVAVFISYFLTQQRNDKRKFTDTNLIIIERLFAILSSSKLYTITTDEDITFIRISQKRIDNGFDILSKNIENENMLAKVTYMRNQLNMYWEHISNHINDFNFLQKSQPELLNYITNIEGRLSELMFDVNKLSDL